MSPSEADINKAMFLGLATNLSMSVMQHLGKLMNPATRKTELNLEAAQATIDMLDMLEVKTRHNRDQEEDKFLKDTLSMLKMNYVETANDREQKTVSSEQSSVSSKQSTVSGSQTEEKTSGQGDKETGNKEATPPKFHKSYE